MPELRTFGGLCIKDGGASIDGAATHRKTLALLALLAAADRNGLSRDKLIAFLWPESDAAHGRSLLKQACYALRRDLHQPDLFLGATQLRLNPLVVTSDVQTFQSALRRGAPADAVQAYAGPFLEGFSLSEAGEFERWVEVERARLATQYRGALESLAHAAAERGDNREAADWWRRLVEADPLSSHATLGLMTALDDAGQRAEAIRAGQAHAVFVRTELGAEPPSEVSALVRRLHQRSAEGEVAVGPVVPPTLARGMRRAHTLSLVALAAVALLAGGTTYELIRRHATARSTDPVAPAGRKMLVVLPFKNFGAPADDYFADGLTEAIATRLGSLRSLGVIAWQSASQYKGTRKSPQEIGRELGVQYILAGSVRWDKDSGTSRIRVTPTLTRVSDAAQLWADQYDTTLSGVFAVQTKLATRVAGALDIALVDAERHVLEDRPTANLQAYDLYLRGRELNDREFDLANMRTAARLYEQAVALDSTFALAYAWLSASYVWMHDTYMDRSPEHLTRAKTAVDRALRLNPDLPESHGALGFYYLNIVGDNDRALEELSRARRSRPNDAYLHAVTSDIYMQEGRWQEALASQHEAVRLDPRNVILALVLGGDYLALRQFAAASYYYDRALALQPQSVDAQLGRALAHLGQTGDLTGSQRLLPDLAQGVAPTGFGTEVLSLSDIVSLLDAGQQERLLGLTPVALEGDSAALALAKAIVYRARGQHAEAQALFDASRIAFESSLRHDPDDDRSHALLALSLASLGRSAEAVREGERAVQLVPMAKDAERGAILMANLARIYVLLGQREKAIDQLEIVLSRPGPLSAGWLKADPFWDPLRGSPRFQRLVAARK
jgi:TolB-like protein/DNA-binding SARP family transcriptional activator/tetratricopeptide (TPR) repeat protein